MENISPAFGWAWEHEENVRAMRLLKNMKRVTEEDKTGKFPAQFK